MMKCESNKIQRCDDAAVSNSLPQGNPQLSNASGSVLIKLLIGIPLALIAALLLTFAFYEGRKAYWDWRVERMCEKDGGLVILDKAYPESHSESRIAANDILILSHRGLPMYVQHDSVDIRAVNPHVFRSETKYRQRENNRLVAIQVEYSRSGGDFLSFHPSSFGCPSASYIRTKLEMFLDKEITK